MRRHTFSDVFNFLFVIQSNSLQLNKRERESCVCIVLQNPVLPLAFLVHNLLSH